MKSIISLSLVAAALAINASAAQEMFFVGSGRANIDAYQLDDASGGITRLGTAAEIAHPSFLAVSPNHRFLYAVTEGGAAEDSSVSSYSIDRQSGKLALINRQPARGAGPCHIEVDQSGKNVLIANYGSGSVAVFPIDSHGGLGAASAFVQDTGSSVNTSRQEGPHAHCIVTDPKDRFAYVCDLGTDKVMIYKFDAKAGSLTPAMPASAPIAPGSGPRHIAFYPDGKWAYVLNELNSTVTVFSRGSRSGALTEVQSISMLPPNYSRSNTAAEIMVDKLGNFVYCSNRGDDSIVQFRCDRNTGRLTYVTNISCWGKTPRHFTIDPSGRYLLAADQDSNLVVLFRIDTESGELHPTGISIPSDRPECVQFQ